MEQLERRVAALEARLAEVPSDAAGLDAAPFEEIAARLDAKDAIGRIRAAEALGRRLPELRLETLQLLRTGSRRQREAIAMLLASKASLDMVADLVAAQQAAAEPGVRAWIDRALGRAGSLEATPHLVADLAHANALVRAAAAEALGRLGDPRAAPDLARLAASHEGVSAGLAAESLQAMGEPAMGHLAAAWDALGPREREAVLGVLVPMEGPEVDRFLRDRLDDASPLVALQAATVLGRRGDFAGRELALERLRSDDPVVARAARTALDAMGAAP